MITQAAPRISESQIKHYLTNFKFHEKRDLFSQDSEQTTRVDLIEINGIKYFRYTNEYWTSKQRQANPIHEIAYRACFKAQLPRFFIELLSKKGDCIYDPFSGRGTTVIEAALLERNIIANDINPLSKILSYPRLFIPDVSDLKRRLSAIPIIRKRAEMDLSMFYHPKTENEIVSLKDYLQEKKENGKEDDLDSWIRMVATNRLTGHSPGFFSVYTLPPNQAVSPESQRKINEKLKQKPEYRDAREIILKKSLSLISDTNEEQKEQLKTVGAKAKFISEDARFTNQIMKQSVKLTVTSPPFMNVVQYAEDNWLRFWFNGIDSGNVARRITTSKTITDWEQVMADVFHELYRITASDGWVAFEVGEIQNGKIALDEVVLPLGIQAGFECEGIVVNKQEFTKTANIWGVKNNEKGTNTNRVLLFRKG